jgi:hypothetical protein
MIIIWLFAGCIFVSLPFYLFYDPYTLWPSLYASGIAAAVYLVALLIYFLRKRPGKIMSVVVSAIVVLLLVTSVLHWRSMDTMTAWQRAQLGRIRTVISDNILVSEDVCDRSLTVFAAYHSQPGTKKNIVPLFAEMYGGKIRNGFFPSANTQGDHTRRYVRYQGDTAVALISVDTVAHGISPAFANFNGSRGRLQTTTIITAEGVRYERNN